MRRPSPIVLVAWLVCLVAQALAQPSASPFFTTLRLGPLAVGVRLIVETDRSRPALPDSSDTSGRVMPIAIWYPSAGRDARATPMRVDDYIRLSAAALSGRASDEGVDAFHQRYRDGPAHTVDELRQAPMAAVRDAEPLGGPFPLVLFAHAAPDSQSLMAEHLASHGFIVAAVRSRGAGELAYRLSRENLDAMAADLEFAWARLQREPSVRPGPAAFIGMSNGAIAAMAVQLSRPIVAGVVSLDGGIGEDAGGTYLRERSGNRPRLLGAPLVHFYTEPNPHLNLAHLRGYDAASRTLIRVADMRHVDFLNDAMFTSFLQGDVQSRQATESFTWVARYTLRFVQAAFSGKAAGWLADAEPAPPEVMTIEHARVTRP
jgi:hypothetical protein